LEALLFQLVTHYKKISAFSILNCTNHAFPRSGTEEPAARELLLRATLEQPPGRYIAGPMPSPRLFVISAPSGAGKTSLVRALLERLPNLRVSTSHTTRPRRPNEEHGREYFFVDNPTFKGMVDTGAFLEHARVFDNQYGTSRIQLEEKLVAGHDVVLEIDWQGARQVRALMPDCRSIFILPPSVAALRTRLTNRHTDSAAVIERRLADAVSDMSHYREFDYVVVNDDFDMAVDQLARIIRGEGSAYAAERPELVQVTADLLSFPTP
jgi:guanylate kinase